MKSTWFWQGLSCLLALLVGLPIVLIFAQWLSFGGGEQAIWQHLLDTRMPELAGNTVVLILGVGLGVSLLGISLAWLVTMCSFPGRRLFEWALMLPLAIPGYVMAFVFLGLFTYAGPVQSLLRRWFGSSDWFPDIQHAGGVILVLSLVLYPYVYMLSRAAFLSQGRQLMDAGRSLGLDPRRAFFRVALPVARPAIAGGLALALMETLADFGAVSVFNYDTFTTAIYSAWYGLFNRSVAAQLASLLLLFVAVTLALEHYSRKQARFESGSRKGQRFILRGRRAVLATGYCCAVLGLAFVLPVGQLVAWVLQTGLAELDERYLGFLGNTLILATIAALLTTVFALLLGFNKRLSARLPSAAWHNGTVRLATLGYALPGSVLAVGIMLFGTWFDQQVLSTFSLQLGVGGLVLAYITRFMAVAYAPVDSGMNAIRPAMTEAARSLGAGELKVLTRVYVPMLTPGLLTAAILVFVDVMKEMPATLIMRPFNGWDTLAVRIYQMTAEGQWERAALPALTLLLAGLVPILMLVRSSAGSRRDGA